jgi:tRNA-modifying protein YgfZ
MPFMSPYQATYEAAAVFDLGDRGKIELCGKDARMFLHNLCTQDINGLPANETREAFLTTNKARVIAHAWVMNRGTAVLWLDFAGPADPVLKHLDHHIISEQVEIVDRTHELGMLRLCGNSTRLRQIFQHVLDPEVEKLRPMQWRGTKDCPCMRRQNLIGPDGYDLFFPAADKPQFCQRLLDAGIVFGDPATYNVLRVEAGLPEFGIDIDSDRLAMEVNRPDAICYTKGCYLGQETIVMARDRGQANRKMMGLMLAGAAPATSGTKVYRGAEEAGQITSSVFSPRLNKAIAMAYLRRGCWDAGIELTTAPGGVGIVTALPFVQMVTA